MKKIFLSNEWIELPFVNGTEKGSILDFSYMLDAPAGKYGRVRAKGDYLYFSSGKKLPLRFNGTNLVHTANIASHEEAEQMAEDMAACGFNVVRIHHHDGFITRSSDELPDTTQLDETAMDRLDYLAAACRKRGIYLITDLFISRRFKKGEFKDFPDRVPTMNEFKRLVFINEDVFENLVRYTNHFLNHYNPYTNLFWKEDPALVSINMVNEDSIQAGYHDWVEEIYLDEFMQYAAEEKISVERSVKDPAYADFLYFIYTRFNHAFRSRIHKIGYDGLLTDLNMMSELYLNYVRKDFDLVENHFYVSHPSFPETPWKLPAKVEQKSAIPGELDHLCEMFRSRIFHKPFSITEWNWAFPSEFYLEGAALTAAYSSLQDYSILCRFAWSHSKESITSKERIINYFDSVPDPLRRLSERILTCLFLRRDVKTSSSICAYVQNLSKHNGFGESFYNSRKSFLQYWQKMGMIDKTGVVFTDKQLPDGKKVTAYYDSEDLPEYQKDKKNITYRSTDDFESDWKEKIQCDGNIVSSTNELTLNPMRSTFMCVTSKSECFILQKGQTLDGSFMSVTSKNGPAVFFASSQDHLPLEESKKILLLHLTSCLNSQFDFVKEDGYFDFMGESPILMRKNHCMVTLKTLRKIHLWACSFEGKRLFEVSAEKAPDGESQILYLDNTCNNIPVAVYELNFEE